MLISLNNLKSFCYFIFSAKFSIFFVFADSRSLLKFSIYSPILFIFFYKLRFSIITSMSFSASFNSVIVDFFFPFEWYFPYPWWFVFPCFSRCLVTLYYILDTLDILLKPCFHVILLALTLQRSRWTHIGMNFCFVL